MLAVSRTILNDSERTRPRQRLSALSGHHHVVLRLRRRTSLSSVKHSEIYRFLSAIPKGSHQYACLVPTSASRPCQPGSQSVLSKSAAVVVVYCTHTPTIHSSRICAVYSSRTYAVLCAHVIASLHLQILLFVSLLSPHFCSWLRCRRLLPVLRRASLTQASPRDSTCREISVRSL